jgi:ABC-type branched-subunit amino acid transport system permease subunit
MRTSPARNGIQTGITFGVIVVLMFLIGFTVIGAQLTGKILGNTNSSGNPDPSYFAIFMILVGLWCGSSAAKRPAYGPDKMSEGLLAGLYGGLICGLFTAVTGFLFGSLAANHIDVRPYLASVSPDTISLFLFNLGSVPGSLVLFGMMTLATMAGSVLAVTLRTSIKFKTMLNKTSEAFQSKIQSPIVTTITHNKFAGYGMILLAAVAMIILPRTWGGYWNYVFGTVGIYIILGLGLNIVMGWAGQLVIGYVAFFAVGAYTFALLTAPEPQHLMWNFWVALVIAIIMAALSGLLIGLPILNLRGDYLAIVTLGFSEIFRILLKSDLMTAYTGGPRGVHDVGGPTIFGIAFNSDVDFMYLIIIAVLVTTFLACRLQNSRTGKAWVAINLDETVARATGINAFVSKLLALALSAAVAGLAGALFASRNQFTGPDDHVLMVAINVICLVIVGGIGNIWGIFLGAFALKGLPEILREIENYRMLVFGILLIAMMRLRPEGFLPAKRPALEKFSDKSNNSAQPDLSANKPEKETIPGKEM